MGGGSGGMMPGRGMGMGMGSGGMGGMMGMMGRRPGMGMGMGYGPDAKKAEETTLTRTDFAIHFVWKPAEPAAEPKTEEELVKELEDWTQKLTEAREKTKGAAKPLTPEEIAKASEAVQQKAIELQMKLLGGPAAATKGQAPPAVPGAPATPPVPAPAKAEGEPAKTQ
jgi:hypothetical protein